MRLRLIISLDDEHATIDAESMVRRALARVPKFVARNIDEVRPRPFLAYSAGLFDGNGVRVGRVILHGDQYELTAEDNEVQP